MGVDRSTLTSEGNSMANKHIEKAPRKIVGVFISPEMAHKVKAEAAIRGLSIRALF